LENYETTCVEFHIYFLSLKNELKIFLSIETYEKADQSLKGRFMSTLPYITGMGGDQKWVVSSSHIPTSRLFVQGWVREKLKISGSICFVSLQRSEAPMPSVP